MSFIALLPQALVTVISAMSEQRNCFLWFWRPRYKPQLPVSGGGISIVPLRFGLLKARYSGLGTVVGSVDPQEKENAKKLKHALSSFITLQIRHYLRCRLLCILMLIWNIGYDIIYTAAVNPAALIWLVVMSFIWAILTRMVMNAMPWVLIENEGLIKAKLAEYQRMALMRRISIGCGKGGFWLEVGWPETSELQGLENSAIPVKIAY